MRFQKLKQGLTISCGCHKKENPYKHAGEKYGMWVVLRESPPTKRGDRVFLCQCSCDKKTIKTVKEQSLKTGRSRSCGCQFSEQRINKYLDGLVRKDNTSGINGVTYDPRTKKWASELQWKKLKFWLGRYDTAGLAALARKIAETEYLDTIKYEGITPNELRRKVREKISASVR